MSPQLKYGISEWKRKAILKTFYLTDKNAVLKYQERIKKETSWNR